MTYSLNLDFETRATVDLVQVGAHVYARHPNTRVLCASYSLDGGKTIRRWETWRGKLMPKDLAIALADPQCLIEAWNANFERLILKYVLRMDIPIERFRCTMARAKSMALPGKLELCAKALSMPVQKSDNSIMLKWCKPLKDGGWAQDEKEYDELLAYCDIDVATEAGIGGVVRDLSKEEWHDYACNEAINDRGIPVDLDLARAAQRYAKDELHEICERLNILTKGRISSPKQFARIKAWLEEYLPDEAYETVFLDDKGEPKDKVTFDAATREELLGDDTTDLLTGNVREFVELVHDGGRASSAKFAAMLARGSNEARVYGAFVFNGAGQTGRFSGTGVQTQNLIRDKLENIETVVEAILKGVPAKQLQDIASYRPDGSFVFDKSRDEQLTQPYNVLTILGRTLKAAIVADDGKTLLWGDWKSIEAVVNPWLSTENSANELLEYFGQGKDIYVRQAALTYGVAESAVTKGQRQAGGKVPILSFGFGGGAGAIMRMARAYDLTLDEKIAEHLKRAWREANPWATRFWTNLEIAAYQAVRRPETVYEAGRIRYMMANDVLWCLLPSGRMLAYPFAKISLRPNQWGEEQEVVTALKGSFHPKKGTNHWPTMQLWGGFQAENVTQGCAACLLRWAVRELHDNGWPLIGTTHDELLLEIEEEELDDAAAALRDVMTTGPDWAAGLPLLADISAGYVYGQGREIK
jgi:DNA polymerase